MLPNVFQKPWVQLSAALARQVFHGKSVGDEVAQLFPRPLDVVNFCRMRGSYMSQLFIDLGGDLASNVGLDAKAKKVFWDPCGGACVV